MLFSNSKKKMALIVTAFLFISMTQANAQEKGPIELGGWVWTEPVTLNGTKFSGGVWDSYKEQRGKAYVQGLCNVDFWLYDTYTYHNGNGSELFTKYIPYWIENYYNQTIDFDKIKDAISPNERMPYSVKALMKQRGCDVAIAYIDRNLYNSSMPRDLYVIINCHDKKKDTYWSGIYPLIGNESDFHEFIGFESTKEDEPNSEYEISVNNDLSQIEGDLVSVGDFYITKESIGVMSVDDAYSLLYKLNDANPGFYYRLPMYADWIYARNKVVLKGDYPYPYGWTQAPIYILKEKIEKNSENVNVDGSVSDNLEMDSENGADNDFNTEVFKYENIDLIAEEVIRLAQVKAGTDFTKYTGETFGNSGVISSAINLKNNYILGVMRYGNDRLSSNHIGFVIAQGENFKKDKSINEKLKNISRKYGWKIILEHYGLYNLYYAEETEKAMIGEKKFIKYLSDYEQVSDELAAFLEIFK